MPLMALPRYANKITFDQTNTKLCRSQLNKSLPVSSLNHTYYDLIPTRIGECPRRSVGERRPRAVVPQIAAPSASRRRPTAAHRRPSSSQRPPAVAQSRPAAGQGGRRHRRHQVSPASRPSPRCCRCRSAQSLQLGSPSEQEHVQAFRHRQECRRAVTGCSPPIPWAWLRHLLPVARRRVCCQRAAAGALVR